MDISDYRGIPTYVGNQFDGDGDLAILGRCFPRAEVARLRDHLTAVLGDGPKPAPNPAPAAAPPAIEVGREYRLLPDSRYCGEGDRLTALAKGGATRVVVVEGPDSDGDVQARALDGSDPGYEGYVDPAFLAPLDALPAASVAQAAREVAEEAEAAYHRVTARWFRAFADKLEGKSE